MQIHRLCVVLVASVLLSSPTISLAYSSPYISEEEFHDGYSYEPSSSYQAYYEEREPRRYERYEEYEPSYEYERPRHARRAYVHAHREYEDRYYRSNSRRDYSDRMPQLIKSPGERIILISPRVHAWGAYSPDGKLLRSGLATSGGNWCPDVGRPCRTRSGSFRIASLGNGDCYSKRYPLSTGGGAPMPYCMFFNKNQGLHGSNEVRDGNVSHGCVRVSISDAAWIRYNFARVGTRVVVQPY